MTTRLLLNKAKGLQSGFGDQGMTIQIVEPGEWPAIRDSLPPVKFLLDQLVPAGGITFVHGPPGCGKSAFVWGAANAISVGQPYLGLATTQANCLLLSTDMNLYMYKIRWGDKGDEKFTPAFPFAVLPRCNISAPTFLGGTLAKQISEFVGQGSIQLLLFDALGGFHAGLSARDDETATLVVSALTAWFPDATKIVIAHDRKLHMDETSGDPSDESILGSQVWRASATSQIHMWPAGPHKSMLKFAKSQVTDHQSFPKIPLYIDMQGRAELWSEHRASDVIHKAKACLAGKNGLSYQQKVACLVDAHKISERTAQRWLSLAKIG